MKKLRVGILLGGRSGEHEVSLVSGMSVYKALDTSKYEITMIGIDKTGRWIVVDAQKLLKEYKNPRDIKLNEISQSVGLLPFASDNQLIEIKDESTVTTAKNHHFDVIFPVLHGTYGEDGTVQGLLELADIAFVGSSVLASSVCMDKELTKRVVRDAGIPIVPFLTVHRFRYLKNPQDYITQAERLLGYPYFVKPANMGSSVGVHKVKSLAEARAQFDDAFKYDTKILVEKAIDAREIECAVLGNHDPRASVLGEIIPHHEFYSYEAKYLDENGASIEIPADLPQPISDKIRQYAVDAFKALECAGMARIDFFLDRKSHDIYLNELNTIPGFTSISLYPKLWEASGTPYGKLLDQLITLALERHREKQSLQTNYSPQAK